MNSNKGENSKGLSLTQLTKKKISLFLFFFLCGILALGFCDPVDCVGSPFEADSVYKNGTEPLDTSLNKIQAIRIGFSHPYQMPFENRFYLIDISQELYLEYPLFCSVFTYRAPPALVF